MDAYKQAAPPLLNELARLLSQHQWKAVGCIPHGIVNILNYSWKDLTAGEAEYSQRAEQTDKRKSKGSLKLDQARSRQVSGNDKREAGERNSCFVENVGPSVGRPQVSLNPRKKKRKQKSSRGKFISASHVQWWKVFENFHCMLLYTCTPLDFSGK